MYENKTGVRKREERRNVCRGDTSRCGGRQMGGEGACVDKDAHGRERGAITDVDTLVGHALYNGNDVWVKENCL